MARTFSLQENCTNGEDYFNEQYKKYTIDTEYFNTITQGKFPDRDSYVQHIPIKLNRIVNKALYVSIEGRYENILGMTNDLSSVDENLEWFYNTNGSKQFWRKIRNKEFEIKVENVDEENISMEFTKNKYNYLSS